jgi:hypothetical protein
MKPGVCVGLTMKSIEYLSHSLPLINNIRGDTAQLVRDLKIGVNAPPVSGETGQTEGTESAESYRRKMRSFAEEVLRLSEDPEATDRAKNAYENLFTRERFEQTLVDALDTLVILKAL